ncbi:MAG: BrnT family toxin [Leptospirillum sp.]
MKITYDPVKHLKTLKDRGLDFEEAVVVFASRHFTRGEDRFITIGRLRGRMVVLVWTMRGNATHIISMRKANDREAKRFQNPLD